MGNCLFIPSEDKIEYRNPCLFPGVGFSEAVAASFTHSIPIGPHSSRKKSATTGTLLTAVFPTHNHAYTHPAKSGTGCSLQATLMTGTR